MPVEIIEESASSLGEYERIPIAFEVRSRYVVTVKDGTSGFQLVEKPCTPFLKDYDVYERPTSLPDRFDVSNWGFFAAFDGKERIAGAIAAWNTTGVEMLEEKDDIVCLWDIRVLPNQRGRGIGRKLFTAVERWANERRCALLKIETQDINVPACKFYENLGCELRLVAENVYPVELNEVQLLWYKGLAD